MSLVFTAVTLPLTFSRTAIVLEAISLLVLFRKWFLLPLAVLPFLFSGSSASLSGRLALFNLALRQFFLHPVTGLGLGNFPVISPSFQPVHLIPLLLLSELGLPFFLLLLFPLAVFIKKIPHLPLPLLLSWICILATSLVDHYWLTLPQNLLLLFILLAQSLAEGLHISASSR